MSSHTLFISDLHLEFTQSKITELFLLFLEKHAVKADALYILGDFFETWVGDDDRTPFNESIKAALKKLNHSGVPIYLMRGNRDFLLGDSFAKSAGCKLIEDPCVVQLYGRRILLSHGDILCTQDISHLRFRKWVHDPNYYRYFLKLPLSLRKWIAKKIRHASQKNTRRKDYPIMDVASESVMQMMLKYDVKLLIHGHTHRPYIHTLVLNGQPATRIVLGDWHDKISALIYYSNGEYELI